MERRTKGGNDVNIMDSFIFKSGPERYAYTLKQLVSNKILWIPVTDNEFALQKYEYNMMLPIWPAKEFGNDYCRVCMRKSKCIPVTLDGNNTDIVHIKDILSITREYGWYLNIFPTVKENGTIVNLCTFIDTVDELLEPAQLAIDKVSFNIIPLIPNPEMETTIPQEEFNALVLQNDNVRYRYTLKRIAWNKILWIPVKNSDLSLQSYKNNMLLPIWSAKEFGDIYCRTYMEGSNCKPALLNYFDMHDKDIFAIKEILEFMALKKYLINVFPTNTNPFGYCVSIDTFINDINVFFEDFGERIDAQTMNLIEIW